MGAAHAVVLQHALLEDGHFTIFARICHQAVAGAALHTPDSSCVCASATQPDVGPST